jgi:hypothetical protein
VPIDVEGSTVGLEDSAQSGCGGAGSPDVGFVFVAPFSGTFSFDTVGSEHDTVLSVRDLASCGELACNDDTFGVDALVEVPLAAGQAVLVVVDGFSGAGQYRLHVEGDEIVPTCTVDLGSQVPVEVSGSTFGQGDDIATSCIGGGAPDVTFLFTAPRTGLSVIDTAGSDYDTVLELWDGECGGPVMACIDDPPQGGLQARIRAFLDEGQTVTIVVDGYGGGAGNYVLSVE